MIYHYIMNHIKLLERYIKKHKMSWYRLAKNSDIGVNYMYDMKSGQYPEITLKTILRLNKGTNGDFCLLVKDGKIRFYLASDL